MGYSYDYWRIRNQKYYINCFRYIKSVVYWLNSCLVIKSVCFVDDTQKNKTTSRGCICICFNVRYICFIIYITDTIISCNVASKLKKTIINLDIKKDSTQEFTKLVRETIKNNNKFLQERLYKAFPNIDLNKLIELKNGLKDDIREITDDVKEEIKEFLNK